MSTNHDIILTETKESGKISRRFHISQTQCKRLKENEEISTSPSLMVQILTTLSDIFMPAGYPNTVTSDYFRYQVFDSLQAFSSSVAGLLASRAVLEGVGVGDANASATGALLLTVTQDAVSRLATIAFAWRIGTALEPEAKRYRLLADVFNDSAMIMDCLSPALPRNIRVVSLCFSGSLRALCGVAAGGAKAALSVHFAKSNNIGDLNAKDSSQETVIGLLGTLTGSYVVSVVTTRQATWSLLLFLIAIHLTTNYLAVRAVTMISFNRQRLTLAYSHFRSTSSVPSPAQIAKQERIFAIGGKLIDSKTGALGICHIGMGIDTLFQVRQHTSTKASVSKIHQLLNIYASEKYILDVQCQRGGYPNYHIYLKVASGPRDYLKAWIQAIELAHLLQGPHSLVFPSSMEKEVPFMDAIQQSLLLTNEAFSKFCEDAILASWDIDNSSLLTKPSHKIEALPAVDGFQYLGDLENKKSR